MDPDPNKTPECGSSVLLINSLIGTYYMKLKEKCENSNGKKYHAKNLNKDCLFLIPFSELRRNNPESRGNSFEIRTPKLEER